MEAWPEDLGWWGLVWVGGTGVGWGVMDDGKKGGSGEWVGWVRRECRKEDEREEGRKERGKFERKGREVTGETPKRTL